MMTVPQGRGSKVSIPQSGFGAFELKPRAIRAGTKPLFQSLSRDSGRLNLERFGVREVRPLRVSIPQSGFGAFERRAVRFSPGDRGCFNPSVGIRGV